MGERRAGDQALKGVHRSQHGAADSPAEGGGRKGDPRVGKASELERSHGAWSSGSSASLLGCNFLHHPKSSPRTVAHHRLEGQPGKGQAHRPCRGSASRTGSTQAAVGWWGRVVDGDHPRGLGARTGGQSWEPWQGTTLCGHWQAEGTRPMIWMLSNGDATWALGCIRLHQALNL